jgi:cyclo(L-tyrosyl-L-tyrosyl) synthase
MRQTAASGDTSFVAEPLTARCREVAAQQEHACVGISLFNGYVKRARVAELCGWATSGYGAVQFHVPDAPSEFTLRALGMPAEKARRRAHENGLKMRNRITAGTGALGLACTEAHILDRRFLRADGAFRTLHRSAQSHFESSPAFRDLCLRESRAVLAHRLPPGSPEPTDRQVTTAVRYFLADIPLLVDTPAVVGAGASVYCHHRRTPFAKALYGGELPVRPSPRQGYVVVRPAKE